MVRTITYIAILLSCAGQQLIGQTTDLANGFQITGMAQLGIPQNEFGEAFNGNPTGVAASISMPMGKSGLLRFGGEYAWNSMGQTKTTVDVDNATGVFLGDMKVSSETRSYHAFMRFAPIKGRIRPYFDGFFGLKSYSTDTEVIVEETDGTEIRTTNRLSGETTNSYGLAGGLAFALSQNFFFDMKLQWQSGGEVRYVDQESLQITEQGEVDFELKSTSTDLMIPQVGLSIFF